eukprot:NODE_302_length_3197_cov_10.552443.p1 GENE.NODE_302_length_3197_cov_10.552443~~NODE_302_length_3197_cov_10.552443.p1  ORF type:complete len:900 (+),score=170.48 NODE_302_length_3197_cov_10.552443:145-2844(+)
MSDDFDTSIVIMDCTVRSAGKVFGATKMRKSWVVSVNQKQHRIEFTNSMASGWKRVFVNNALVHEVQHHQAASFQYNWVIDTHCFSIIPVEKKASDNLITMYKVDYDFMLFINGLVFRTYPTMKDVERHIRATGSAASRAQVPRNRGLEDGPKGGEFLKMMAQVEAKRSPSEANESIEKCAHSPPQATRTFTPVSQPAAAVRKREAARAVRAPDAAKRRLFCEDRALLPTAAYATFSDSGDDLDGNDGGISWPPAGAVASAAAGSTAAAAPPQSQPFLPDVRDGRRADLESWDSTTLPAVSMAGAPATRRPSSPQLSDMWGGPMGFTPSIAAREGVPGRDDAWTFWGVPRDAPPVRPGGGPALPPAATEQRSAWQSSSPALTPWSAHGVPEQRGLPGASPVWGGFPASQAAANVCAMPPATPEQRPAWQSLPKASGAPEQPLQRTMPDSLPKWRAGSSSWFAEQEEQFRRGDVLPARSGAAAQEQFRRNARPTVPEHLQRLPSASGVWPAEREEPNWMAEGCTASLEQLERGSQSSVQAWPLQGDVAVPSVPEQPHWGARAAFPAAAAVQDGWASPAPQRPRGRDAWGARDGFGFPPLTQGGWNTQPVPSAPPQPAQSSWRGFPPVEDLWGKQPPPLPPPTSEDWSQSTPQSQWAAMAQPMLAESTEPPLQATPPNPLNSWAATAQTTSVQAAAQRAAFEPLVSWGAVMPLGSQTSPQACQRVAPLEAPAPWSGTAPLTSSSRPHAVEPSCQSSPQAAWSTARELPADPRMADSAEDQVFTEADVLEQRAILDSLRAASMKARVDVGNTSSAGPSAQCGAAADGADRGKPGPAGERRSRRAGSSGRKAKARMHDGGWPSDPWASFGGHAAAGEQQGLTTWPPRPMSPAPAHNTAAIGAQ